MSDMNNCIITITWQAFGEPTSATIDWYTDDPLDTCEKVFRDTNLYQGTLWNVLEPFLPYNRTHTALSVGDSVTVQGTTYLCEGSGWSAQDSSNEMVAK